MLKSKYENTKNEMDIWQQTKIFQMLREIPDSSLVNGGGGMHLIHRDWLFEYQDVLIIRTQILSYKPLLLNLPDPFL